MKETMRNRLINDAKEMSLKNFCCPHTDYSVGAALLTKDGRVFKGFNVENDGILSICAERVAFAKALTEGCKEFVAIAVAGKDRNDKKFNPTIPCGYCRQFMREYTKDGFQVLALDENEKIITYKIEELLPYSYRFEGKNEK